jgi:hypothetical protein
MTGRLTSVVLVGALLALLLAASASAATLSGATGTAPAAATATKASAAPYLLMFTGRWANQDLLEKRVRVARRRGDDVYDWRLSQCFRWANNAIQCRWWYVAHDWNLDWDYQCYGNSRATRTGPGTVSTRTISARCTAA